MPKKKFKSRVQYNNSGKVCTIEFNNAETAYKFALLVTLHQQVQTTIIISPKIKQNEQTTTIGH